MSPQKENGYMAIANEIVEALIKYPLPGVQMQCLLFILRKTYGYNKKTDSISLSQFEKITGLDRRHIHRAINELSKKNVIKVIKHSAKEGTKKTTKYQFNKIYTSWAFVPKKARGSAKQGTKHSAKEGTYKRHIKDNKEIYKENSLGVFKKKVLIPSNFTIQKEHFDYAVSKGLTKEQAQDQFEAFCLWHGAKGTKYMDWFKAYQTWVRNSISRFQQPQNQTLLQKAF